MTLVEACDRLRDYLEKWYAWRVRPQKMVRSIEDDWCPSDEVVDPLFDYHFGERKSFGSLTGQELCEAKEVFMSLSPECKEFDFDLYYNFDIVPGSNIAGNPTCGNGCCLPWDYAKARGVVVEVVDWF